MAPDADTVGGEPGSPAGGAPRLVVVDDNPDDRALIVRQLERELPGAQIIAVGGPEEWSLALAEGAFEAVVTDYQLGWSDGIAVLDAVKGRYPDCPVIMFTNTGSEEIAVEAMKRGLDDYLIKTRHSFSRLPAIVGAALARQAARRRLALLEGEQLLTLARERAARREAEESRAHLQLLAEASATFAAAQLDLPALLERVARQIAPAMGGVCALALLSEDGRWLNPAGLHHQNPEVTELLRQLLAARPYRLGDGVAGRVAATGQAALMPKIDLEAYRAMLNPEYWPYLDRFAPSSGIVVPLRAHSRIIGTLTVVRDRLGEPYTPDDQQLLQELADRAALAIENALLFARAKAAVQARDQFFIVASHELRTPLTALLGNIDIVQRRASRDGELPERYRKPIQIIAAQGQRLNRLIAALLDFSRMETGQLALELAPVELGGLAAQVVDEFQLRTARHSLTLITPEEPVVVSGDELRLGQVLFNLIQNAVSYSPAGGPVEVRIRRDGTRAIIAVTDVGMGIPHEVIPHIFQRYYRAPHINSMLISGMGLGLYIVQEIVARHGGEIAVESAVGAGSTFTVALPIAEGRGMAEDGGAG